MADATVSGTVLWTFDTLALLDDWVAVQNALGYSEANGDFTTDRTARTVTYFVAGRDVAQQEWH